MTCCSLRPHGCIATLYVRFRTTYARECSPWPRACFGIWLKRRREHPGVQHQVLSIAQGADLTVDAKLDLDFRTLYPTERPDPEREIEMLTGAGLPDSFVDRWTRRSPDEVAASLARIESEAILAYWPQ